MPRHEPPWNARLQPGIKTIRQDSGIKDARLEPGVPRGWYSRGYVPHFDSEHVVQHVTFHLADSLPAAVLARLTEELRSMPRERHDAERRKGIDAWIDAGYGCCLLREADAARLVQDALLHFDGRRYELLAWIIMPNHVHALVQLNAGMSLSPIVTSWKSFTGRRLSAMRAADSAQANSERRIWHREYWDRYIRDADHFHAAREYIHRNPVEAGLVARAEDWEWSSARLTAGDPS